MGEKIDHPPRRPVVVSGIEAGEPVGPGEMREITRSLPGWNANRGLSVGIHDDGGRAEDGSSWIGSNRVEEGKSPPPGIRIESERGPNPSPNKNLSAGEGVFTAAGKVCIPRHRVKEKKYFPYLECGIQFVLVLLKNDQHFGNPLQSTTIIHKQKLQII